MKERPILFNSAMVKAILNGSKTQTRRILKNPEYFGCFTGDCPHWHKDDCSDCIAKYAKENCPFGKVGDRLWVRETWCPHKYSDPNKKHAYYRADHPDWIAGEDITGWKPSIHMPRWASRITLEITDIRVERLQDISEEDARAEGVLPFAHIGKDQKIAFDLNRRNQGEHPHTVAFASLWDGIANEDTKWKSNPWVWVIRFRRIK